MNAYMNNFGALCKVEYGNILATKITAGLTTLDNVDYESATIDRAGYGSAKIMVGYSASLACGVTAPAKITVAMKDSTDDSTWTDYADVLASSTLAAITSTGVKEVDVDLASYSRYIKVKYTPDLTASNTDTLITGFDVLLGGATELPAS